MLGQYVTVCICAVLSGVLLLIALPSAILRKMHFGSWAALASSLVLGAYAVLAAHFPDSVPVNLIGSILLCGAALAAAVVVSVSAWLGFGWRKCRLDRLTGDEVVIVLGARVYHDHLSRMLVGRLEAAQRVLLRYPQMKCIVSGGKGHDEPRTEAAAMKEWLLSHGVEAERVLLEDRSTNTEENLRFSAAIMEAKGLGKTAVIATDFYHQYRASVWAKRAGLVSCGVSGFKEPLLIPAYWLREIIGVMHMAVFARRR